MADAPTADSFLSVFEAVLEQQVRDGADAFRDEDLAARQVVRSFRATGQQDMDVAFGLARQFQPVYVRVHFSLCSGQAIASPVFADLVLSQDSGHGDEYDVKLYTYRTRGLTRDVNLLWGQNGPTELLAWTFGAEDKIRFAWSNTDSIRWGLQVGLVAV